MNKLNRNQILGLIILCFFGAATFKFFVWPPIMAFVSVRNQYHSQKELLIKREEKRKELKSFEEKIEAMAQEVKQTEGKLLKKEEITSFLETISQIVKRTGNNLELIKPLTLVSLGVEGALQEEVIAEQSVRLEVVGSFLSLKQLLTVFQEHKRLLKVEGLKIYKGSRAGVLDFSFILKFYVKG